MKNLFSNKFLKKIFFLTVLLTILFFTNHQLFANISKLKATFNIITLPNIIETNTTLTPNNTYLLNGKVVVKNNAVLTIEPGTRILAIYKDTPSQVSTLIITRGSKIQAVGTENNPIVFTGRVDATNPVLSFGDWGGIIILGNAPTNKPTTTIIEGINATTLPAGVTNSDVSYGGNNSNDNSGTLSYVRVEYAGAVISPNNEINSFTFGGVGSATIIDHLQAYRSGDDSFEFFGGNVNGKYLISTAANDDAFDFDNGYTGKLQFLVAVLNPNSPFSFDPNAIESDNDETGSNATPITRPIISNLTIVGTANGASNIIGSGVLNGITIRRNSDIVLYNSIVYGFRKAILNFTPQSVLIENNIIGTLPASVAIAPFPAFIEGIASNVTMSTSNNIVETNAIGLRIVNPFQFIGFFNNAFRSLRPTAPPTSTGANFDDDLSDSFFIPTLYKGAISPINNESFYWIGANWVNKFLL